MKILFIGSNPDQNSNLNLLKEITELQRRTYEATSDLPTFVFLPQLSFDELSTTLHREKPDIVHLSAHGDGEGLTLSNEASSRIKITGEELITFLGDRGIPELIYLNACDSDEIAKKLVTRVPMAIGSTAAITNGSARYAAVNFYEQIFIGNSVHRAFDVCKTVLETSMNHTASMQLYCRPGVDPGKRILYRTPKIVAEILNYDRKVTNSDVSPNTYAVRIGLSGMPRTTKQIVFFTDDASFISDNNSLEDDLCHVLRLDTVKNTIWMNKENAWETDSDFAVFAVGVTLDGRHVFAKSTICDALTHKNEAELNPNKRKRVEKLIKRLLASGDSEAR